jgi:hypothetical protein
MKKISFNELEENENWEEAVIVFTAASFNRPYSEKERSYKISRKANYFNQKKISTSIFGNCLDGTDDGIRLDLYMHSENPWKIDYCYVIK